MATVSATVSKAGKGGSRILKFEGFDCKTSGETTEAIDAGGYDYAIIYAVDNTKSGGAGTGRIDMRVVLPDGSAVAGFRSSRATGTGVINAEEAVGYTSNSTLLGSYVEFLPDQFTLVHDGGNSSSTTFTIDLYVELHRYGR